MQDSLFQVMILTPLLPEMIVKLKNTLKRTLSLRKMICQIQKQP